MGFIGTSGEGELWQAIKWELFCIKQPILVSSSDSIPLVCCTPDADTMTIMESDVTGSQECLLEELSCLEICLPRPIKMGEWCVVLPRAISYQWADVRLWSFDCSKVWRLQTYQVRIFHLSLCNAVCVLVLWCVFVTKICTYAPLESQWWHHASTSIYQHARLPARILNLWNNLSSPPRFS